MTSEMPESLREKKSPREQLHDKCVRQVQQSLPDLQNKHFGKLEIADLYTKYASKVDEGNKMTPELFRQAIAELMQIDENDKSDEIINRYYKLFDTDSNGNISFIGFVTGASVLLRGTL
jgi:Ca2+-binding EF-hand superfamily protein